MTYPHGQEPTNPKPTRMMEAYPDGEFFDGVIRGTAVEAAPNGTMYVAAYIDLPDEDSVVWRGWLTPAAHVRTFEALGRIGWEGAKQTPPPIAEINPEADDDHGVLAGTAIRWRSEHDAYGSSTPVRAGWIGPRSNGVTARKRADTGAVQAWLAQVMAAPPAGGANATEDDIPF